MLRYIDLLVVGALQARPPEPSATVVPVLPRLAFGVLALGMVLLAQRRLSRGI